jgi:hypothetical protein
VLPSKGWATYEAVLRAIGERRPADEEIIEFLRSLDLVAAETPELTDTGRQFFHLQFIEEDTGSATEVLRHQLLGGVPGGGCDLPAAGQ